MVYTLSPPLPMRERMEEMNPGKGDVQVAGRKQMNKLKWIALKNKKKKTNGVVIGKQMAPNRK